MGFFGGFLKTEVDINEMVTTHLDLFTSTVEDCTRAMNFWLKKKDLQKAEKLASEARDFESRADDLRREIETRLINGALLAKSRKSTLSLLEKTDKLANAAEATLDFVLLQRIEMPQKLVPLGEEIVDLSLEIVLEAQEGLTTLLEEEKDVLRHTERMDRLEGEVDRLERSFVDELFSLKEISLAEKTLIREFLEAIVEISDRAEDLSEELEIIAAAGRR